MNSKINFIKYKNTIEINCWNVILYIEGKVVEIKSDVKKICE